jgi:hypothetical protein
MLTLYCHAEFNPKAHFPVRTLAEASQKYLEWLASGPFANDILGEESGVVRSGKDFIAQLSYNGKAWTYGMTHQIHFDKPFREQLIDDIKHNTDFFCPVMAQSHHLDKEEKRSMILDHVNFRCTQYGVNLKRDDMESIITDTITKMEEIDRQVGNRNE